MMDSRSSLISSLKPATKSSNLNQTKIRNQKLPIQNRSPRPLRNPFLSQQPLNRLKKGKWKTKTRRRSYRNLRLPVVWRKSRRASDRCSERRRNARRRMNRLEGKSTSRPSRSNNSGSKRINESLSSNKKQRKKPCQQRLQLNLKRRWRFLRKGVTTSTWSKRNNAWWMKSRSKNKSNSKTFRN